MYDVVIAGGGLAGLVSAYLLRKSGFKVALIERKTYPFHRVCGEYISNETIPFLKKHNLFPQEIQPVDITHFQLTSIRGKSLEMPMDLGGFGISRYQLDDYLYKKGKSVGVEFLLESTVERIDYHQDAFSIKIKGGKQLSSKTVIGAFGKRSNLDRFLDRSFMKKRSPYIGVKYHIRTDHPDNLIALHNFAGGYCGISNVENGLSNLCYLGRRDYLRKYDSIEQMEKAVLWQNPYLKKIFQNAEFIFDKPLVINEISFATKSPVEQHVLMSGDAAGMVTPLCGNGMAMAIRSAGIVSKLVERYLIGSINRQQLEAEYARSWRNNFSFRLWTGRKIQYLFGKYNISDFTVLSARKSNWFGRSIMKQTHGQPFE